jgi:ankyrin repeat protein
MSWSQDVVVSVLFPYLLPSLPVCKSECWSRRHIRSIFEELLLFYCGVPVKRIRELLKIFIARVLSISSINNRNLDRDLYFLADIERRCSFTKLDEWRSSTYSLYACSFLIENKVDIHEKSDCALRLASENGYEDVVALLIQHKAAVHACCDASVHWASYFGHKDTVALLLEHKANVHAQDDQAIQWASQNGYKDIVALLIQHKENIHADK